ncbi:nucleoside deaminase [bacterium]|nr:nucleoside deaminase [bacterium]
MLATRFDFDLPSWVDEIADIQQLPFPTLENRMQFVIRLARLNVKRKTGGPFGAAVFETESGRLVSLGVNLVTTRICSMLHAEIVALVLAQKRLERFSLRGPGLPAYDLVSSVEPCAMCMGAVPWSGISRLVCGARHEDAEAIGFDEGAKPADWTGELQRRGIEVIRDVKREDAAGALQLYRDEGGVIYNG